MNFKSIGFKAAIATAVVASSAIAISPAQAGDIRNKTLSFTGSSVILKNNVFNFADETALGTSDNYSTNTGTGRLSGTSALAFGTGTLIFKDLRLAGNPTSGWKLLGAVGGSDGPVADFITGLSTGIKYTLNTFKLTKITGIDPITGKKLPPVYQALLGGVFNPGAIGDKDGSSITSQRYLTRLIFKDDYNKKKGILEDTSGSSFSGDITAVPTPALLPGLLSLGVAALRKRKTEESDVEAAETAKA